MPQDFTAGNFRPVIAEHEQVSGVRRVVLVSGKIYYDLIAEREKRGDRSVAILRLEQLYPLHGEAIAAELAKYPGAEVVWAQDEPANQGPWPFVALNLPQQIGIAMPRLISRPASASPAAGSHHVHEE